MSNLFLVPVEEERGRRGIVKSGNGMDKQKLYFCGAHRFFISVKRGGPFLSRLTCKASRSLPIELSLLHLELRFNLNLLPIQC